MKQTFYFKRKLNKNCFEGSAVLAQTELGNIVIKDNKLYIPVGPDEVYTYMTIYYVYDFEKSYWVKKRGKVLQRFPVPILSISYNNLYVNDLSFFSILCTRTDEEFDSETLLEMKKTALRERRERDCYPIVNRGKLWYDMLSYDQVMELDKWYKDWLNVTETLKIPPDLDWVNKKLEEEDIL